MKNYVMSFKSLSLTLVLFASSAFAAPSAIERKHQVDLSDFRGKTFLQAMTLSKKGIKAQIDADYEATYQVADWKTVESQIEHFSPKNVKKLMDSFDNGKKGLESLVDSLEGKSFKPSTIIGVVRSHLKGGDIYAVSQFIAMASGAGTLVTIDGENYYYNYGYKSGEEADDVKTGRSFGAGPAHNAIDASDAFYLTELESYLNETDDLKPFYEAILKVLVDCDTTGFHKLSNAGQTVATDFLAIYTAESDRHIMVDLDPKNHPWENDLAGATFVSAFGVSVGKVMKDGSLQKGTAKDWWAMSKAGNGRSGIGITRIDRTKLQRLISSYMRENNASLVEKIESITDTRKDGDVFQGLLEFLNTKSNQTEVSKNGTTLVKNMTQLLAQAQEDAEAIESHVQEHQND